MDVEFCHKNLPMFVDSLGADTKFRRGRVVGLAFGNQPLPVTRIGVGKGIEPGGVMGISALSGECQGDSFWRGRFMGELTAGSGGKYLGNWHYGCYLMQSCHPQTSPS